MGLKTILLKSVMSALSMWIFKNKKKRRKGEKGREKLKRRG